MTAVFVTALFTGCASTPDKPSIDPLIQAQQEVAEEELLDVGILPFEPGEVSDKQAEKEGTTPRIRKAESHFIPYHLKNTMQRSGNWGAVRVLPDKVDDIDLVVSGEILQSNGERLELVVEARDATGHVWFRKKYKDKAKAINYVETNEGDLDAFQDVYNEIANDLYRELKKLPPEEVREIRTAAQLAFAADFAPQAYGNYVEKKENGRVNVLRLPAEGDPMMARLMQVREREFMYIDTLNDYYELFYNQMWPEYENWRKFYQVEQQALREVRTQAWSQAALGVAMIAAAVLLETEGVENTGTLRDVLVLGGTQVVIGGFNVSKQAAMHKTAIAELSETFSSQMEPIVVEFEGKKYELSGTTQEQYAQWRALLHKIYQQETGFDTDMATPDKQEKE